jgi:hypothetical protein
MLLGRKTKNMCIVFPPGKKGRWAKTILKLIMCRRMKMNNMKITSTMPQKKN